MGSGVTVRTNGRRPDRDRVLPHLLACVHRHGGTPYVDTAALSLFLLTRHSQVGGRPPAFQGIWAYGDYNDLVFPAGLCAGLRIAHSARLASAQHANEIVKRFVTPTAGVAVAGIAIYCICHPVRTGDFFWSNFGVVGYMFVGASVVWWLSKQGRDLPDRLVKLAEGWLQGGRRLNRRGLTRRPAMLAYRYSARQASTSGDES